MMRKKQENLLFFGRKIVETEKAYITPEKEPFFLSVEETPLFPRRIFCTARGLNIKYLFKRRKSSRENFRQLVPFSDEVIRIPRRPRAKGDYAVGCINIYRKYILFKFGIVVRWEKSVSNIR